MVNEPKRFFGVYLVVVSAYSHRLPVLYEVSLVLFSSYLYQSPVLCEVALVALVQSIPQEQLYTIKPLECSKYGLSALQPLRALLDIRDG